MIHITSIAQAESINKYVEVLPVKVLDILLDVVTELEPNEEGFIWELHDGWRFAFECTREDLPDPEEDIVEWVDLHECDGVKWVFAVYIENNETACTYIFPLETYPEYANHVE